jgi:hypothetical protein
MASFEEETKNLNFRGVMIASIITAISFAVALMWRDAITETIKIYFPGGENIFFRYFSAVVITIIGVIASFVLLKSQKIKIQELFLAEKKLKVKKTKKRERKGLMKVFLPF